MDLGRTRVAPRVGECCASVVPGSSSVYPGRLVLVRHGTTAWSRAGRHTGRTDVPLEDQGRAEAGEVGRSVRGHAFARVLTSPLSRARETCELAGFGARAEICDDLREWDYGEYEGLTTAQIRETRPGWTLWKDGVLGGETIDQVAQRADHIVALARSTSDDTLVFAHGHILRVICARWLSLPARDGALFVLGVASLGVLGWEHETAAIVHWNEKRGDPLA